jgi:hypothetical protein
MPEDGVNRCPFQPTNPVDLQFFVGRQSLIETIHRIAKNTFPDRIAALYLGGIPRIGKTSLANYAKVGVEQDFKPFGFHVLLEGNQGPENSEQFFQRIVTSMIEEKNSEPTIMTRIEKIFKHVILEVNVGVVKVNTQELQASLPRNASSFYSFLYDFGNKLHIGSNKGFVLVLDEIDGVANRPFFATFLKELFDASALARKKVPLLLLICGTMEKFHAIKANNPRAADLMKIIPLEVLTSKEVKSFFQKAFRSAGQDVEEDALETFVEFSNGMPQLMHLVGEATFCVAPRDRAISQEDACRGVAIAAEDYGRKFVNQRVQGLLDYDDYAALFEHLCDPKTLLIFTRKDLIAKVGKAQAYHVDSLLKRLTALKVIEKGDEPGEWKFIDPMVSVYLHMLKMKQNCNWTRS